MEQPLYVQSIIGQFKKAHAMLEEAVKSCPESEWRKGATPIQRPAAVAYHILGAAEFFTCEDPKNFTRGGRFGGVTWTTDEPESLPSQEQILAYLSEINTRVETWLTSRDLLAEQTTFPKSGATWMGHTLYHLRHTQHHVADISCELTQRGLKSPDWQ